MARAGGHRNPGGTCDGWESIPPPPPPPLPLRNVVLVNQRGGILNEVRPGYDEASLMFVAVPLGECQIWKFVVACFRVVASLWPGPQASPPPTSG